MVEKKEGAEMTCLKCQTKLVCHMSNYKGDFKNKLQWQNQDGTAHYKFNGSEYSCNIPENVEPEEPEQTLETQESDGQVLPEEYKPPVTMESLRNELKFQREILQSILHTVVDLKTQGVKLQK